MLLTPEVRRCADRQGGIVTRRQLREAGVTDHAVAHRVRRCDWQRVRPGVYATFSGPIPFASQLWAAVLYAGDGAVISHGSASHVWRWTTEPSVIEVTVPAERRVAGQPGVRVRRAALLPSDITRVRGLPCTTPWRTAVDLVACAASADDALGIVADAVESRRVTATHLFLALEQRGRLRWRGVLLPALEDVAAGSNSLLELKLVQALRSHGVAPGVRQKRLRQNGRWIAVDIAWPGLAVELDGLMGHAAYRRRLRDMDRDNVHAIAGRSVLRFGWSDVVTRGCDVVGQIVDVGGMTAKPCGARCPLKATRKAQRGSS
ncbi:MAG: hypothetical protein QOF57_2044 [Frankiaceae bacterium]|nr:hypothetical protein [Frankiaceae bacterium]